VLADAFLRSGKVRDLVRLNDGRLLLVASDRISAFDVILPTEIPDKGKVLTGLSRFWFTETASITRNHLLATEPEVLTGTFAAELRRAGHDIPDFGSLDPIRGRMMICRPAQVVPIEAVVRGYLSGSGWKEYHERGTVCGIPLAPGLRESEQLPEPIFTPATKAALDEHDQNVTFDEMVEHIASEGPSPSRAVAGQVSELMRDRALRLYRYGAAVANRRGILLADTKFEFGLVGDPMPPSAPGPPAEWLSPVPNPEPSGEWFDPPRVDEQLTLIDEVMTPDSSRFWDAVSYQPGGPQPSYDKQFVRDWLERQPWDKTAPGPELPDDVVAGTRARYIEAFERITGASFQRYLDEDVIAPPDAHRGPG
jgi:phosphoribosylaminoimidazole-succinocarboxamide synthase